MRGIYSSRGLNFTVWSGGDCFCLGYFLNEESIMNSVYAKNDRDDFLFLLIP